MYLVNRTGIDMPYSHFFEKSHGLYARPEVFADCDDDEVDIVERQHAERAFFCRVDDIDSRHVVFDGFDVAAAVVGTDDFVTESSQVDCEV